MSLKSYVCFIKSRWNLFFFLSFCSIILFFLFCCIFCLQRFRETEMNFTDERKKRNSKNSNSWELTLQTYVIPPYFFFREINYGCVNDWVNQNGTFMVKWRWFWWCQNISWSIWPKLSYLKLKKKNDFRTFFHDLCLRTLYAAVMFHLNIWWWWCTLHHKT